MDQYLLKINPGSESDQNLFLNQLKKFLEMMTGNVKNFSWSILVHRATDTDEERRSIIYYIKKLSFNGIQKQAMKTWNNKATDRTSALPAIFKITVIDPDNITVDKVIFYEHTRTTTIIKRILNSITVEMKRSLFTKKNEFI